MALIEINTMISAIARLAAPAIKSKLERNEIVIQLLKQFNLDPEHPPADFAGVYAYTLVEYGAGKPKPMLELFRHDDIRQAFRKAFDQNDPSMLLNEAEHLLDWNKLGDEIRELRIDPRLEFAAFSGSLTRLWTARERHLMSGETRSWMISIVTCTKRQGKSSNAWTGLTHWT